MFTATYSPEDNKLRLYSESRLDLDLYKRVTSAGFKWAPKQGFFVAPMWHPQREDLLIELCGDIGDEDTSLVERSEQRAERFEGYQANRANDAERALSQVAAIAENIPFGQPILVGHHSEKHARKDAQRIENGMRKAVKMWETSEYWSQRAAGAIHHAKYKELPEVRARRIKGLEADKRKQERTKKEAEGFLHAFLSKDIEAAKLQRILSNYGGGLNYDNQRALDKGELSLNDALEMAIKTKQATIAWCNRWINHYTNRLAYEVAMLDEQGASQLIAKKERPKQLPLCNYMQASGFDIQNRWNRGEISHYPQVIMTKEEYSKLYTDYKGTETIGNSHRVRLALIPRDTGETGYGRKRAIVFLSDSKVTEPPMAKDAGEVSVKSGYDAIKSAEEYRERVIARQEAEDAAAPFEAMKKSLKAGVQVVTANQLFPTPADIAERMVEMADIKEGETVLEPSAGTGRIIQAIMNNGVGLPIAIEINPVLAEKLRKEFILMTTTCTDFLSFSYSNHPVDKIIMNPPFENASDIKHIKHALTMLKPGGLLVAICANGPRQNEQLQGIADYWEVLPSGTFEGTNVSTILLTIRG